MKAKLEDGIEDEYVLVLWPLVQELMEYDWFRKECYLLQAFGDQEHFDSAYFVPRHRLDALQNEECCEVAM